MKKAIFVVMTPVLFTLLSPAAPAQYPATPQAAPTPQAKAETASPCPRLEVRGSNSRMVRDGQPVMVVANIAGGDPNVTPSLIWNVSAGTIRDGQGTNRIEIDTTGAGEHRQIVADLWVGGYAPECGTPQATVTVNVVAPANKVDEFGDLDADKENERVGPVAAALLQSNDDLYVIAYAGRTNPRGYAAGALQRITGKFVKSGVPAGRIVSTNGGYREQPAYELWIVPQGAEPPRPTPTVNAKDIVFPKTAPPAQKPVTKKP